MLSISVLQEHAAKLTGASTASSFLLSSSSKTRRRYFCYLIYGGNRDMCAWRMIGFPGARDHYRDWVNRHNERYPHPPWRGWGGLECS